MAVPGVPGEGIDTDDVADQLPRRARRNARRAPSWSTTETVPVLPRYTDEEAQALADRANGDDGQRPHPHRRARRPSRSTRPTLRTWIGPTTADGALDLAILPDAVNAALPEMFSDVSAEPKDARRSTSRTGARSWSPRSRA